MNNWKNWEVVKYTNRMNLATTWFVRKIESNEYILNKNGRKVRFRSLLAAENAVNKISDGSAAKIEAEAAVAAMVARANAISAHNEERK